MTHVDLNPPAYEPTLEEDEIALLALYIENDFWGMTHTFDQYFEIAEGIKEHPSFETYRQRFVEDFLEDAMDFLQYVEPYESWWRKCIGMGNWYANHLKEGLSEEHCGDCTAFPATCTRCCSESYYGVPYTATWSKSAGHAAYYAKHDKRTPLKKLRDKVRNTINRYSWRYLRRTLWK